MLKQVVFVLQLFSVILQQKCKMKGMEKEKALKKDENQTLTNILAPEAERVSLFGEQKTDMDFLSRENSRVSSFLINCFMT